MSGVLSLTPGFNPVRQSHWTLELFSTVSRWFMVQSARVAFALTSSRMLQKHNKSYKFSLGNRGFRVMIMTLSL
jgi:hypothetical protein